MSKEPPPPKKSQYKLEDFNLSPTKRDSTTNIQGYDHFRTSSVSLERPNTRTPKNGTPINRTSVTIVLFFGMG